MIILADRPLLLSQKLHMASTTKKKLTGSRFRTLTRKVTLSSATSEGCCLSEAANFSNSQVFVALIVLSLLTGWTLMMATIMWFGTMTRHSLLQIGKKQVKAHR